MTVDAAAALDRRLSRRQFAQRATALAMAGTLPAVLEACGGSGSSSSAKAPADSGPITGELDFLSWQGYDLPKVPAMEAWKRQHHIDLKASYISTGTDVATKTVAARGRKGTPDLITYYMGYKPRYEALKILQPIDEDRIPNLKNMFPFFDSASGGFWKNPDGTRTGVPFLWGTSGLNYDADVFTPTSYFDLLDPKLKGKVILVDDGQANFTQAAQMLGLDASKVSHADYPRVKKILEQLVAQTKGVSPTFADITTRLVSGEGAAVFAGFASINLSAAQKGKKSIRYTLPKEGGTGFCDAWAVPPTCDNVPAALGWINETLNPAVARGAAEANLSATPVKTAVPLLNSDTASLVDYKDIDSVLAKAPFYDNPPLKSSDVVTLDQVLSDWQDIKSKAKS